MGRKQHQGDKLWLTTQEWKYFFGGKKPGRKADPDEVKTFLKVFSRYKNSKNPGYFLGISR
jgi:hypothetical protein